MMKQAASLAYGDAVRFTPALGIERNEPPGDQQNILSSCPPDLLFAISWSSGLLFDSAEGPEPSPRIGRDFLLARRHSFEIQVGMIEPPQARFQSSCIEVHEEAGRAAGELQVGDDLGRVDSMQLLDRLHFDDEALFDQDVELERSDTLAAIFERYLAIGSDLQPFSLQLDQHAVVIDGLQQPWSKGAVYGDGAAYGPFRQSVDVRAIDLHECPEKQETRPAGFLES